MSEFKWCYGRKILVLSISTTVIFVWLTFNIQINILSTFHILEADRKQSITEWNITGEKWIVMYTNSSTVLRQGQLKLPPGWKLVMVGESDTMMSLECSECWYLGPSSQKQLNYSIMNYLPLNNDRSMLVGCLFAIQHGAKMIYETVEGINIFSEINNLDLNKLIIGEIYDGKHTFDLQNQFNTLTLNRPKIHRREIMNNDLLNKFDCSNTIYIYDALWAMILPVVLSKFKCDTPVIYVIERLLLEIDKSINIYHPGSLNMYDKKYENKTHNGYETKTMSNITELAKTLMSWECPAKLQLSSCVQLLCSEIAKHNYLKMSSLTVMKSWLGDLRNIGYVEPRRKPLSGFNSKPIVPVIIYFPRLNSSGFLQTHNQLKQKQLRKMSALCKNTFLTSSKSVVSEIHSNILLIIVFNFPFYDYIPHLEAIYGAMFPKIIYCGSKGDRFQTSANRLKFKVTFLAIEIKDGFFFHRCWSAAMKMNHTGLSGYLMVGDDTLLNTWNIKHLPLDKIWFYSTKRLYRNHADIWYWWRGGVGQKPFNKAWDALQTLSTTDLNMAQKIINFTRSLKDFTGSDRGLLHGWSDIVYVPQTLKNDITYFVDFFSKFDIFLEIVIPTVIAGLTNKQDWIVLNGQYLWYDGKRNQVPKFFKKNDIFLHPVKLSQFNTSLNSFYCKTYFPLVFIGQ